MEGEGRKAEGREGRGVEWEGKRGGRERKGGRKKGRKGDRGEWGERARGGGGARQTPLGGLSGPIAHQSCVRLGALIAT